MAEFDGNDDEASPAVAVISESLARRLFPGGDAVVKPEDLLDLLAGFGNGLVGHGACHDHVDVLTLPETV